MVDCCNQIVYHRFIALTSIHYYLITLVQLDNNMNGPVPSTSNKLTKVSLMNIDIHREKVTHLAFS